jgi:glucose/arabinose dehydrogenase
MSTRAAALLLLAALVLPSCATTEDPDPGPTPLPTCGAGTPVEGQPNLTTQIVASGLSFPVDLQSAPGDRTRLYVVEQTGRIRLIKDNALVATPFLDISAGVSTGGERGLLGLAFHPRYAENGRFYVNYTNLAGDTRVTEFRRSQNPDQADLGSERLLIAQDQPFSNHNGGGLAFGNDGRLYIGLGDGGSAGDPQNNAQNLQTRLGKILRIDVDTASPYAIPTDNPFVNQTGPAREVWALGLRNPWRFSFDRATGDLYIGDVGQNRREEIDIGLVTRGGGANYGWRVTEGTLCFNPTANCGTAGFTPPVVEYDHSIGCSVTGGYVYRGCRMPGYGGTYFYGDFCTSIIRSLRMSNGTIGDQRDWTGPLSGSVDAVSAFGVDADGELYIVDYSGRVLKIVPQG